MIQILFLVVLGLCVGNLINLIVVNILAERPWLTFHPHCEKCDHELSFLEQVPFLSFILCAGRCKYCKLAMSKLPLFVELGTAIMFVVFATNWQPGWYLTGMLTLGCTLLAVTETDVRARLIPHDITYPSMFCGLLFSNFIRHDLTGALLGVAISYVVFDFLAHYSQKIYLAFQSKSEFEHQNIELVGGADAVLAAVIAAWLGWMELLTALMVSFVVGALMAAGLALHRAFKHGEPDKTRRAGIYGAIIGVFVLGVPIMLTGSMIGNATLLIGIAVLFGLIFGFACGVVAVGPKEPYPFPFGPALAVGAFVAMFYHVNYVFPSVRF